MRIGAAAASSQSRNPAAGPHPPESVAACTPRDRELCSAPPGRDHRGNRERHCNRDSEADCKTGSTIRIEKASGHGPLKRGSQLIADVRQPHSESVSNSLKGRREQRDFGTRHGEATNFKSPGVQRKGAHTRHNESDVVGHATGAPPRFSGDCLACVHCSSVVRCRPRYIQASGAPQETRAQSAKKAADVSPKRDSIPSPVAELIKASANCSMNHTPVATRSVTATSGCHYPRY